MKISKDLSSKGLWEIKWVQNASSTTPPAQPWRPASTDWLISYEDYYAGWDDCEKLVVSCDFCKKNFEKMSGASFADYYIVNSLSLAARSVYVCTSCISFFHKSLCECSCGSPVGQDYITLRGKRPSQYGFSLAFWHLDCFKKSATKDLIDQVLPPTPVGCVGCV